MTYCPFDTRWLYWERTTKLLDRNRTELFEQVFSGNLYLEAVRHQRRSLGYYDHGTVVSSIMDLNFVDGGARCFPLYERRLGTMFEDNKLNFRDELLTVLLEKYGEYPNIGEDLFYHIVAILNSPKYRLENAGDIEQDWPRIPIPVTRKLLEKSASIGLQVTKLLRPDTPIEILPRLRTLAIPTRINGSQLTETDLIMTISYGNIGKYELTVDAFGNRIGRVWWNNVAFWDNVPEEIWKFTIGGYPVVKKWLDYRHFKKLGRPLRPNEIRLLTQIVQRIAMLLSLNPSLDDNYIVIKNKTLNLPKKI